MDLSDSIQLIQETAREATATRVIRNDFDPLKYFVDVRGELKEFDTPLPVRRHQFLSLTDLIKRAHLANDQGKPVLWHNDQKIMLYFDDDRRLDWACFDLVFAHQFKALATLGNASFEQKNLIQLLRIMFADCLDVDLLPLVRKINFRRQQQGESAIQHGRESMDRSITAELTGAGDMPEMVTITCHVYQNLHGIGQIDTEISIPCAIEINVENETFQLLPLPGEIDERLREVGASIHEWLVANAGSIPVYYGTP